MNVVKVPEFGADAVLGDVDVRMIVSLARPPNGTPYTPRSHPEPGGSSGCPDVVLVRGNILVSVEVYLAQEELEKEGEIGFDQSKILMVQYLTWLMSASSGYTRNEV